MISAIKKVFLSLNKIAESVIEKLRYNKIENSIGTLISCTGKILGSFTRFLLQIFVGSTEVHLRAVRPYPSDEDSNNIRLSKNVFKVLGIDEGDKVLVEVDDKPMSLRALVYEETEVIDINDTYYFETIDSNFIIGIPDICRYALGIDVNTVVKVQRDMWFLVRKNINTQIIPVLGISYTTLNIFHEDVWRIFALVIFVPTIMYMNLSSERSKVSKKRIKQDKNR